jgi:amino acid adenylation domain-containing protein/non-ribosomal peptide synthase protein (TIGR01720 family)
LRDGETDEVHITYAELDWQARAIGALLQSADVVAGERVLLLYPPGLEYIAAFFGCLYAGTIAVPCYPPRLNWPNPRLKAVVADSQATAALTLNSLLSNLESRFALMPDLASLRWITTDNLIDPLAEAWQDCAPSPDTVAFLQYTSGSTSIPKGVMVSHGNLLHNERMIQRAFGTTEQTTIVSWLPLYHDMGLIGNVLHPLYVGFHGVLMSPVDFMQKPVRWLQAISRYKATLSGGPNFAYDLCVRKITPEQQATLDLSSWELAYSGAEPVRHETLKQFARTFGPCGFRQEAFYPCYGLAEATLFVSGDLKSAPPVFCAFRGADLEHGQVAAITADDKGGRILVGCGQSDSDQKVVIVNPEYLTRCPPNQVGEIWVSSPSVTQGYWNRPEETEHTFRAHLDTGEAPFLRTGDLGFLQDGELFVTGRLKDLIIIRGRNHYPQDIELTVEQSHPALRLGCGAAFSVDVPADGALGPAAIASEQLVIVQEVERHVRDLDVEAVARKVRQAVAEEHEVQVYAVVLIQTGTIPKTSSGKIQRHACRAAFLDRNLEVIGSSILEGAGLAQSEERLTREALLAAKPEERRPLLEAYLQAEVARILQVTQTRLSPPSSLSAWGLDSLMALELKSRIEADLGVSLPLMSFLHDAGITYLVTQILGQLMDSSFALPSIVPAPNELHQPFPLTDVQQVYWVGRGGDFELGNVATHGYQEFDTVGLDLERFEQAWQRLIGRHAMLRAIVRPDGQQQVLVQVPPYHIEVLDLRGHDPETVTAQLEKIRQRMSHQVLPSDQWPLFEIRAARLDDQRVRLYISLDLLIGDAWSIQIMGRELAQLYLSPEKPLAPLDLSFRDYVLAEMTLQESEMYRRSLEYWQSRLPTLPPAPELPLAKSPRSLTQPRFVRREARMEPENWLSLKARAAQAGLTPSGVLLAAFAEVLTTWSQSPRFTINLTLFNRLPLHSKVNDIVGDFTSLTLLEVDNSARKKFEARARRLQNQLWKDLDHRYVSGVRVLRELAQAQGGAPRVAMPIVFTSTLGLSSLHQESWRLGQLGEQVYGISQTPQVWLDHQVAEQDGALVFNWDAVQELFPEGLLDDMFGAYCRLLQRLAEEENVWQETAPCLAPPSQLDQRAAINATSAPVSEELLHTLFAARVSERSGQVAVATSHRTLTYADVYRRSNQVGHWLRQRGARPNALVAVVMEKGWEQVVAVLGVLQSGAAYLPIDPELPQERLWYLLEHGQVELVLTQSWLDEHLAWPENVQRLCVEVSESEGADDQPLAPVQRQEDLAYVIYTSGSTGLPKGVMIDHRGAVNTVLDINRRFGVGPADRVLAVSSLSFDLSVYDIFGTLAAGGTIVMPEALAKRDPAHWAEMMMREQVTVWNSVPALMEMLVEYLNDHPGLGLPSLRLVMLSGDWIPVVLPDQIKTLAKGSRVISLGGATEASIWSILYPIEQVDSDWKSIPYGKPMLNQSFHVLDDALEPRPTWVPGQLYIGGVGLAKGYWQDEDKTRSRFITHPRTGERLYWTGDLGRYLLDGNIEFLGRQDFQVKVQGYRIELGEIEAALIQHPTVRAAVATAVGEPRGNKRLVAYIVPNDGHTPPTDELRSFLRNKLPEYMVPSAFVFVEALPLTPNGKVDRQALPASDEARPELAQTYAAPRTPVEELLAGIWTEVLGLERVGGQPAVGAHDNFFELGGHSLLATQVVSRVRQILQVELPLRMLFENPTVAGLADNLRIRRAEQGEYILPLSPVSRQEELPLSFAQQRLWFLDQLEPGSALYNVPTGVRLSGTPNVAALEQSLNKVVQRHEALRTTFAAVDGRPVQVIAPSLVLALPVTDLRDKPESEREAEARRLAWEEARQPFDLAQGPLVRTQLIQLDDTDYLLLLTMHHIISDGWSRGVMIRELASLYVAFATGQAASLPELPIQYADYAVWQRQWLQGQVVEAELAYWKEQLAGVPALDLPTDRTRPAVLTYRGTTERLELSPNLTQALVALSRKEGVTPFMTLLASFQVLLARYSNQTDVAVGSPVANRNRAEIEELIGFFVNTLVLRTDLAGNPSFRELLGRVREVTLGAYAHQDLPFEQLVEELQPARDPSRTPLFQVMFVHHNFPAPDLELPGLSARQVDIDTGTSKFDLTWSLWEGEQNLVVTAEYNTDLFDAPTVQRMLIHWQTLLEGIVADPSQSILALPLLTQAERYEFGVAYNATDVDYAPESDLLLHELFEAQVRRTPAAPAVVTGDGTVLSYEKLDCRANQIAHQLRQQGVGPNVLVAIVMEKGWEQVVAVLGILKAGAAYLPVDPYLPQERRWYLLEYGQAALALTQPQFMESLDWPGTVRRISVDQESLMGLDASPLGARFQGSNDLAYVIFTSGSTGLPKGVMIDHRGAVNTILDINRRFCVGPDDRVLAVSALNFDLSVYDIFGILAAGGTIVIPTAATALNPAHWAELILRNRITVWDSVPALMELLVRYVEEHSALYPACLRVVLLSGDWIPLTLPDQIRALAKEAAVISLGGATEASIWSIFYPIEKVLPGWKSIPYGRPLGNQRFYVLNEALELCPVRVPGQLYIGGIGLAKGYWRDEKQTKAKFLIHPRTGERLYSTGDLGCYLPDVNIEFLGRVDFQVKVQGHRIELGEIETALEQHPAVRAAVASVVGERHGAKRLVAHLVPIAEAPATSELHSFLRGKLPHYMVPSTFVMLDRLPLTANGKVNRQALPLPEMNAAELNDAYVVPHTPTEETLAGIWAKVMGLERVGIDDNFFKLGGDSILSIQIIARAHQMGLRLTPRQIFMCQTIRELAQVVETAPVKWADQGPMTGPVPLTPIQHWFFEKNLPEPHHWNQALLLQVQHTLDPVLLKQAVQHLLAQHDALRLRFTRGLADWQQVNAPMDAVIPLTWVDLSIMAEAEQESCEETLAAQLQTTLDLEQGPLLRVAYFDLGKQKPGRLLIIIHHLAVDGVSWRILLEDLQTAYQQLSRGQPLQLPPKTTSFQHWSQCLMAYAQRKELRQELNYWLSQPWEQVKPLPVDYAQERSRGANTVASVRSITVGLSVAETQALLHQVPEAYHTQINDALLTALAQTFAHWTGNRILLVDLEGHGREELYEQMNVSRTVGWFTTLFPTLLELESDTDIGSTLKATKEHLRSIPQRGINYGLLRYLSQDADMVERLQMLPQAEVSFNYLGQLDQALADRTTFGLAKESSGPLYSPRGMRGYLLEINGFVLADQLQATWSYSDRVHRQTTVERLAQSFVRSLQLLIEHCLSPETGGYTPSDFAKIKLSQQELDDLFLELGEPVEQIP